MESQSYSSSSSTTPYPFSCPQQVNKLKSPPPPPPPFHSSLHSVRKLSAKPLKKQHIAPMPPTPPRVYKVASSNFKQLVQQLTAAPEFQSRRLQSVAPPPLSLSNTATSDTTGKAATTTLELLPTPKTTTTPLSATYRELMSETLDVQPYKKSSDNLASVDPLGFTLSASSHAWYSGETLDVQSWKQSADSMVAAASPLGFSLSSVSHALCSSETPDTQPWKQSDSLAAVSPLGFGLSPTAQAWWCSFPLLSPGTLSSLEQSTVL